MMDMNRLNQVQEVGVFTRVTARQRWLSCSRTSFDTVFDSLQSYEDLK